MTTYLKRKDLRSDDEFARMINDGKFLERYCAETWVTKHNQMRHKLDYCLIPWGARFDGVIKTEYTVFNRPDYFLIQLEDNKRVAKAVRPLEVCTFKNDDNGKFWIKSFKVDWYYCRQTQILCDAFKTRPQILLCVLAFGSYYKFFPLYTEDKLYSDILKRGRQFTPTLGYKSSYYFYTNEVTWSLL